MNQDRPLTKIVNAIFSKDEDERNYAWNILGKLDVYLDSNMEIGSNEVARMREIWQGME